MEKFISALIVIALIFGISWGATVGLLYLACWLINWAELYKLFSIAPIVFSWKMATVIWALACILKTIFGLGSSSKNS